MAVIVKKENAKDIEWLENFQVELSSVVLPGNSDAEKLMPLVTILGGQKAYKIIVSISNKW